MSIRADKLPTRPASRRPRRTIQRFSGGVVTYVLLIIGAVFVLLPLV